MVHQSSTMRGASLLPLLQLVLLIVSSYANLFEDNNDVGLANPYIGREKESRIIGGSDVSLYFVFVSFIAICKVYVDY